MHVPAPMRNHQSAGPFANDRATDRSSFTVAVSTGSTTVNSAEAIWLPQPLSEYAHTECGPPS